MSKISVIMPVYNAGRYLSEAVGSILGQSFRDFEFLVIDDGSNDGSQNLIRSFNDKRIRFIQNEKNIGVAASLNRALSLATGEYIARMDGDDISAPNRLMAQLALLEKKRHVGICGSWVRTRNANGRGHVIRFPLDADTIRAFIVFNNPVNHPVVMIRHSCLLKYKLNYDEAYTAAQDYEFWSRCLEHFPFENIRKVLLTWRINESGMTHRNFESSNKAALTVQQRELNKLGIEVDDEGLVFHRLVGNSTGAVSIQNLSRARRWLVKILEKNKVERRYSQVGLEKAASLVWFNMCVNSSGIGIRVLSEFRKAPFYKRYVPPIEHVCFFLANSVLRLRRYPVGTLLGSDK